MGCVKSEYKWTVGLPGAYHQLCDSGISENSTGVPPSIYYTYMLCYIYCTLFMLNADPIGSPCGAAAESEAEGNGRNLASTCKKLRPSLVAWFQISR